jgi:raffinose/stachyose/melibiose transport system substrate-binding protein
MQSTPVVKRVRKVIAAGAVIAAGLAFAGCSSQSASTGGTTFNPNDKSIHATLNWDGWAPDVNQVKNYVAAFNKVYPNIKVNFKVVQYTDYAAALRPALVSGSGPDIFDLQPGVLTQQYAQFGVDLAPIAEKVLPGWKNKVAPVGVTGLQNDGHQAALSVGSNAAGMMWYNDDLFKKYGVKPPTTLAQWVNVCSVFKSHGATCFIQGAQDEWVNQDMIQAIADSYSPGLFTKAVEGKVPWTNPTLESAFTTFKTLFSDGIMQSGAAGIEQYPDANNAWLASKAAMIMMGSWNLQMVKTSTLSPQIKAAGGTGTFTALPMSFPDVAGKGNPATLFASADYGLAVNKNSKNQEAAEDFVTWMTLSKSGQQFVADELADTPSLKGIQPGTDGLVTPSAETSVVKSVTADTQAATEPREITSADLVTALGTALSSIATGQQSVSAALTTLQSAAKAAN